MGRGNNSQAGRNSRSNKGKQGNFDSNMFNNNNFRTDSEAFFDDGQGSKQRFDSRPRFGSGPRNAGNSANSGPRELHKATCSDCGKECQVPFKPSGERPVYCRDCFGKHKPSRF